MAPRPTPPPDPADPAMTQQPSHPPTDQSYQSSHQRLGVVSQFTARPPMVGWYDPGQLMHTAVDVIISTLFGRYADRRLTDVPSADPNRCEWFDYTMDDAGVSRTELWIDYIADLGDGWNSTYNVAYAATRPTLTLTDASGTPYTTTRGSVLIFGGDQVYPVASRAAYQDKLVRPYEAALRDSAAPNPHLFVVPGNHDWYDNLVAFTRLFCTGRWFAGWQTRQRQSYFALKLPHGWWLIGTDVQLDSDIDQPQLDYFRAVATHMAPDDRIILCVAEPHWIYAQAYGKYDDNCNESNLAFLQERIFQRHISVYVAGDLHHYRRHANAAGAQKITCGGGGAFLHPTNGPDVSVLRGGYTERAAFPTPLESRQLCWRNFLFPFLNPKFGLATGIVYMLLAWAVNVDVSGVGVRDFGAALNMALDGLTRSQVAVVWAAVLLFGFIFFTDTHSKPYRWIGGTLHGLSHLAAVFAVGWWATYVTVIPWGLPFGSHWQLVLAGLLIVLGGAIVGPLLFGIYLTISLNWFGRHTNEAFSSLHVEDWKSFLRIHVTASGVTIYPVGIRKVWKAWTINPGGPERPEWVPDERAHARKRGTPPSLIEAPIVVPRESNTTLNRETNGDRGTL